MRRSSKVQSNGEINQEPGEVAVFAPLSILEIEVVNIPKMIKKIFSGKKHLTRDKERRWNYLLSFLITINRALSYLCFKRKSPSQYKEQHNIWNHIRIKWSNIPLRESRYGKLIH